MYNCVGRFYPVEGSFSECPKFENTVNPLLSPAPPGAHLFQALLKRAYNYVCYGVLLIKQPDKDIDFS